MIVKDKVVKSKNRLSPHLVDLVSAVLVEVVVAGPFFFVTPVFVDDFLFLVLWVALATASLCGKTIPDAGAATTMLFSVVQGAAFFTLFFGGPLK